MRRNSTRRIWKCTKNGAIPKLEHVAGLPLCRAVVTRGTGGGIANFQGKTSPKEGGLGGQSLPELGRGSLPEENQLSRQLSQLENWRAVAARVRHDGADSVEVDGPGSRATDTHGFMAPWYMEEQLPWLRLVGPGDRSKATSFS